MVTIVVLTGANKIQYLLQQLLKKLFQLWQILQQMNVIY